MALKDPVIIHRPDERHTLRMDAGWRFHLGKLDAPLANTHLAAYMSHKAGYARGPARPGFDDSAWRDVDLPHDWSIEASHDPSLHPSSGYLPRGCGWYRRHFVLPERGGPRYRAIRFDGVANHCVVYVNGHLLHRHFCGTTGFTVDISDVARTGDAINVLAVYVDADPFQGWWYEGAGIYRHVWLIDAPALHIAPDGIFVRPERQDTDRWRTHVEVNLTNRSNEIVSEIVETVLIDPAGCPVERCVEVVQLGARESVVWRGTIQMIQPRLWDLADPARYSVSVTVGADRQSVRFGYRSIRFDADHGFFLNDRHVLLKGTCNHQDHTGVGVAVPDSLQRFRIRRLKEIGSNAYRCAHHPPAPELLDACDELGMLVLDENRSFGSSPEHLAELESMVRRDRNHPSVILWSLCNEESIQNTPVSGRIAQTMAELVRRLDPSRPVTAAISGGLFAEGCIGDFVDVICINYQLDVYDRYHELHPRRPLVAGETHCAYGTRGVYLSDAGQQVFSAMDQEAAPWGATARRTWKHLRDRSYIAGLFIWTGFDYHGEPTPYTWPSNSSHWGLLDLCGFEKDSAWLHRAWFSQTPLVHIVGHWNWPEKIGEELTVRVYGNVQTVELLLDGRSLGRRTVDPVEMASWQVRYAPGALSAVGYNDGVQVAEARVTTTGPASALGLEVHPSADEGPYPADGAWTIPVTVFATDAKGQRVPTSNDLVRFELHGPGKIIGVGNGDPNDTGDEVAPIRRLFNGLAQVLVQTSLQPDKIVLKASGDSLASAELTLTSVGAAPVSSVPAQMPRYLVNTWRRGPVTHDRPDLNAVAHQQDMNSWQQVEPARDGDRELAGREGFVLYRATIKPPQVVRDRGGALRVVVGGPAEVFLDGQRAAAGQGSLSVPLAPGKEKYAVAVLVELVGAARGLIGAAEIVPVDQPSREL